MLQVLLSVAKTSTVEITEMKRVKHLLIEISFTVRNLHYFFYNNHILCNQGLLKTERLHRADGAPTTHPYLFLTGTFLRLLDGILLVQYPVFTIFMK